MPDSVKTHPTYINVIYIIGAVLMFTFSLSLISAGFKGIGEPIANNTFLLTSNPFIGLFIGLVVTAIFQSSSATTSLAVAAVFSGSISLSQAIPIVLGANIGTTLTSTLVSLSFINKSMEFRKALAAGIIHDFFNIIMVLLLFPLELKFKILSISSEFLASYLPTSDENTYSYQGINGLFTPIQTFIISNLGGIFTVILAFILLLVTVKLIANLLYNQWIGSSRNTIENTFFSTKITSFGWGLFLTSIVQSSSLVTSLVVPLSATGRLKLERAFHFIIGANLGTTVTAILAALFKSEAAMSLAIAHFLINLFGAILFMSNPFLQRLPIYLAREFGNLTANYRLVGFLYVIVVFFLIPFTLIFLTTN